MLQEYEADNSVTKNNTFNLLNRKMPGTTKSSAQVSKPMTIEEFTQQSRIANNSSGLWNIPVDNSATYTSYSRQKLLKKNKNSSSVRNSSDIKISERPSQNLQAVIEMHREQQSSVNKITESQDDYVMSGISDAVFNQKFHYKRQDSRNLFEKNLKNAIKRNRKGLVRSQ